MKQKLREQVLCKIEENWPTHIKEIAQELNLDKENNSHITKVKYHVDNLVKQEKIQKKKIGKAVVVWPYDIEKLRVIHELLKE